MLKKARHIVNNNHIRHSIRQNVLPRIYKDYTKKEKDKNAYSRYIIEEKLKYNKRK